MSPTTSWLVKAIEAQVPLIEQYELAVCAGIVINGVLATDSRQTVTNRANQDLGYASLMHSIISMHCGASATPGCVIKRTSDDSPILVVVEGNASPAIRTEVASLIADSVARQSGLNI
jgi:hypothetical protein